ncbi:MAG TPA: LPS export ABC transporter periplasmic protein LptC [Candidatus Eisenbacteria bacterium]|nr:LPS export ABC transporter periplasmic protein LptC [Candidatus Eisenbacteria bacterium]
MRKRTRLVLLLVIVFSLGAVTYKIFDTIVMNKAREIQRNPLKALDYLPESALRIKDFHRAKVEDGRKVWELYGDEANYSKEQREAVIKNPRFYYYDKDGETAETLGEQARLFLTETDLEKLQLQGGVRVSYQDFVLDAEEAFYYPAKEQIVFPGKVTMSGDGFYVEGSSMEVDLAGQTVRLERDVKTTLEPDTLAKRKNPGGRS